MCETKTPQQLKKDDAIDKLHLSISPLSDKCNLSLAQQYKKEYYKNNQERFKKMIKCDVCNCNIQKYTLNRHNKLKKHIEFLKKNKELEFIKVENERLTKLLNDL